MTADEIRKINLSIAHTTPTTALVEATMFQARMAREIAAQLAELNQGIQELIDAVGRLRE